MPKNKDIVDSGYGIDSQLRRVTLETNIKSLHAYEDCTVAERIYALTNLIAGNAYKNWARAVKREVMK